MAIQANIDRSRVQPTRVIYDSDSRKQDKRTIIVLGSGRGGTSMVAGALTILGVPMNGAPFDFVDGEFNSEDFEILAAMLGRPMIAREGRNPMLGEVEVHDQGERLRSLASIVRARNAGRALWGFKDPASFTYLDDIRTDLRNPIFVAVFRDIAAIAEREFVSNEFPIQSGLAVALERYHNITRLIEAWKVPTLIVSVERAVAKRDAFVSQLADFAGLPVDPARLALAERFADPASGYKDVRQVVRRASGLT